MIFKTALYLSSIICLAGIIYRCARWFRNSNELGAPASSVMTKAVAVLSSIFRTVFSKQILNVIKVLLTDILLQTRLFKADRLRWFSHFCLVGGFILLLLSHALDELIMGKLFADYSPTINPYLFLRNLFGAFVLFGITLSFCRRFLSKKSRHITAAGDRIAVILLAIILVSGFMLESLKIISYPIFDEMVADFTGLQNRDEIKPLEAYWAKEFGVIFNDRKVSITQDLLKTGREIHDISCAGCHSKPSAAFISRPMTICLRPASAALNRFRIDISLYYIHFLACFIGLAYLPFSKFFHLISVPINQIVQAANNGKVPGNFNGVIFHRIGLDACTHCGLCTVHCSVAPIFRIIANANILPSEKLMPVKAMYFGKSQNGEALKSLAIGNLICSECLRCTELCPSGIRLQELWLAAKTDIADQGYPEPHIWIRELPTAKWAEQVEAKYRAVGPLDKLCSPQDLLSDNINTFTSCIQCTICSNVCPIINAAKGSGEELDYTPQQIMNLLRLSLKEFALGSRMIWNCVTCYMCQENCPQGIRVADILYELRNLACEELEQVRTKAHIQNEDNSAAQNYFEDAAS